MAETDSGGLLTVAEAAKFLRVHPRTVDRLRKSGRLKMYPVAAGSRPRWRTTRAALAEFLGQSAEAKDYASAKRAEERRPRPKSAKKRARATRDALKKRGLA